MEILAANDALSAILPADKLSTLEARELEVFVCVTETLEMVAASDALFVLTVLDRVSTRPAKDELSVVTVP